MKRFLTLILVVTAAAMSLAQEAKQASANVVSIANGPLGLLSREDVQADLAMTAEQKTKLTQAQAENIADLLKMERDSKQQGKPATPEQLDSVRSGQQARIEALLTPDQLKRLTEIHVQIQGALALTQPAYAVVLNVTDEQKAQIAKITEVHQADMRKLFEQIRKREIPMDSSFKAIRARSEKLREDLAKLLTPEQAAKLKEMGGKVFVPAPPPSNKDGG